MDWGHVTLGALVIVFAAVAVMRRRRSHSIHIRVDWEADETYRKDCDGPDTARRR